MVTLNVGSKIQFNTFRAYSTEGQPIDAEVLEVIEQPHWFPKYRVKFIDYARNIKGEVVVSDLTEDAIMQEYDNGNYKNI
ncbi:hypothetical protein [Vibrio phage V-YDF132]|nr:hypothetical protein [Vibrio phage V-YDF132]